MSASSKLTERDKDKYTIVVCLLMICPYIFLMYSDTRSEIQRTEGLIGRQLNRIEVHGTPPDPPTESSADLEKQLDRVKTASATTIARMRRRSARFASLETVDDVKQLRLEITSLAEWTGVSLTRFGDLKESEQTDSVSVLMEAAKNQYRRPVLTLEVTSDYGRLIEFIRGLADLSKTVAVIRFDVEAPEFDQNPDAAVGIPVLTAKLDLVL